MDIDWMLDVLGDMRNFAKINDMPDLAEQLHVAAELAKRQKRLHGERDECPPEPKDAESKSGNRTRPPHWR